MKKMFMAALAVALSLSATAFAHDYKKGDLLIDHPWARMSPMVAGNGVVFMTIHNHGGQTDRLVKAAATVSEKVELHTHLMEDGVMKMRQIQGIDVDPAAPAVLKPGGLHVMLINLKEPLKEGARFPVTLTFQNAGEVMVEAVVAGPGAMAAPAR